MFSRHFLSANCPPRAGVSFGLALTLCALNSTAHAQNAKQPAPKPPAELSAPHRVPPVAPDQSRSLGQDSADDAARQEVLQSTAWTDMLQELRDWLASQSLYDAEQVKQIHTRLEGGIRRMSAPQLRYFRVEMESRLTVLKGETGQQAQDFLAELRGVASPAYAERIRQRLPDILTMSSDQIEQQLSKLSSKRKTTQTVQDTFRASRKRQIANNDAQIRARREDQLRAVARAEAASAAANSQKSSYTPSSDYYPGVTNSTAFSIPLLGVGDGGAGNMFGPHRW